ncbi:MAG: Rrf2 family transcriptional regulator [Burkholderiaceae bacterium]
MRLTTFTDYSLRVLIYLAAEPGRRATIAEISSAFGVSEHHLTKVVHFLGQQGWLANVRGKGGGVELAQPPEAIGIGAVVRAAEGDAMPAECFNRESGGSHCSIVRICRLRSLLSEAVDAFEAVLERSTLADLVAHDQPALARVLQIPRAAAPRGRSGQASH